MREGVGRGFRGRVWLLMRWIGGAVVGGVGGGGILPMTRHVVEDGETGANLGWMVAIVGMG